MKISDIILVESNSEWKFLLSLAGKWIESIEKDVITARQLYDANSTPENKAILRATIEAAKAHIIETVNSAVIADSNHKVAKRIVRQYESFYLKLINEK